MKFKNNNYATLITNFLKDIRDNENLEFADTIIETYLNYCVETINDCDHSDATISEFYEVLEEILGEEFLQERSIEQDSDLNEKFHNFVVHTIKIELDKFKNLDNEFYEFYTSKLNNDYKKYCIQNRTNNYYRCQVTNNRGMNKAYIILQQIAEFKDVIEF